MTTQICVLCGGRHYPGDDLSQVQIGSAVTDDGLEHLTFRSSSESAVLMAGARWLAREADAGTRRVIEEIDWMPPTGESMDCAVIISVSHS